MWLRHREDEVARSLAAASDVDRWDRFVADVDAAVESNHWNPHTYDDVTWSLYLAHAVSVAAVLEAIRLGGRHVATSPADAVSYEALRAGGGALASVLALLFTSILATGRVPAAWKVFFVQFLFKKFDDLDIKNYRADELHWKDVRAGSFTSDIALGAF